MVRLNNIWFYFLNEPDIPNVYLNVDNGMIYLENNDFTPIPKVFKRVNLLKNYISSSHNSKLIREIKYIPDCDLREYFHCKYSPYFDLDNYPYSNWMIFAKKEILVYVEKWCWENGIIYTMKECDNYSGFTYLELSLCQ